MNIYILYRYRIFFGPNSKFLKLALVWFCLSCASNLYAQQLKLGDNSSRFDSSAALEIESQKLVLLLPRINDTSIIVKSVKNGSLIYFTDAPSGLKKGFYLRSNNQWGLLSDGDGWLQTGNTGINSNSDFLGTTDNHPLVVKANNTVRLFIDSTTGNIGLNTSQPLATLDNRGSTLLRCTFLADLASDGPIGTAATTVDNYSVIAINQLTSGRAFFIPAPADITPGRVVLLLNTGSVAFVVGPRPILPGKATPWLWTGTDWVLCGDGVGSGNFNVPYYYRPPSVLGLMEGAASRTRGLNNIAIGRYAMKTNEDGSENVALGAGALANSKSSSNNVAVGVSAMGLGATGNRNVAVGWLSLMNCSSSENVGVGVAALRSNISGTGNTVAGHDALLFNTTGSYNTAIGRASLQNNIDGNYNVAVGVDALKNLAAGSGNTVIGRSAMLSITNNTECSALGYQAGDFDGTNYSWSNLINANAIGTYSQVRMSHSIVFGSESFTYETMVGIGKSNPGFRLDVNGNVGANSYSTTSDARLKKDIRFVSGALDKILRLRAVTFNWNLAITGKAGFNLDSLNHLGFIAQEVESVLPGLVHTDKSSQRWKSIAYLDFVPVLSQALNEQQPVLDQLKQELELDRRLMQTLQQHLFELERK